MVKKVLIAAGGTGGHLFPAMALAEELEKQNIEILFAATHLSKNPYFDSKKYAYVDVEGATFSLRDHIKMAPKLFKLSKGCLKSLKIIMRYQPDVVVGFGSYHSLAVLAAAFLLKKPVYLNEQNRQWGKVNRLCAPFAKKILTHYPQENSHPKIKCLSMPLRFKKNEHVDLKKAHDYFQLEAHRKTLLIFGGSQGAKSINEKVSKVWLDLAPKDWQVLHLVGSSTSLEEIKEKYKQKGIKHCVKVFESEMEKAYQIADLVLSRAGASTLFELIHFNKPALLIPYPHAGGHQAYNAEFFEKKVKGGMHLLEKNLTDSLLKNTLSTLMDEQSLKQCEEAISLYESQYPQMSLAEFLIQEVLQT